MRKRYITYILAIFISIGFSKLKAQQLGVTTHFVLEQMLYNPAYSGKFIPMYGFILNRSQWTTIEGHPSTQMIGISKGFDNNSNGLGFMIFNDKIGPINNTGTKLNYAYHLPLGESFLSIGISARIYQFNIKKDDVTLQDPTDEVYANLESRLNADATLGFCYYTNSFDIGISFPNLVANKIQWLDNNDTIGYFKNKRQIYLSTSYRYSIDDELSLKFGLISSYTANENISAQINSILYIKDLFWLGVNFKADMSAGLLLGMTLKNKYKFGYSFDLPLSSKRHYFSGSHELYFNIGLFNSRKYEVSIKNRDLRY